MTELNGLGDGEGDDDDMLERMEEEHWEFMRQKGCSEEEIMRAKKRKSLSEDVNVCHIVIKTQAWNFGEHETFFIDLSRGCGAVYHLLRSPHIYKNILYFASVYRCFMQLHRHIPPFSDGIGGVISSARSHRCPGKSPCQVKGQKPAHHTRSRKTSLQR